ncbi:MAG: hypothetical protein KDA21_06430, partial [Phycisphaerales bacterium]|nr:hypothetical protein [Phycisphaerales bacterium]
PSPQTATITLRARLGAPLKDPDVHRNVVAAAHALAERIGIPILHLQAGEDALTVTLQTSRIGAVGFAAELRRITNAWYTRHHDASLWGADPGEDLP